METDRSNTQNEVRENTEGWENTAWLKEEAEEIKAARKSGDTDDPVDVILYDPIAIRLTHRFIKAGWSANAVTILSLFVGVGGSLLFYPQNRWINLIGILIVMFAAILDCCDGQIARLTNTSSQLGRVLDGTVDIVNFLSIYIVLGLRMSKEAIPFTDRPWSYLIWIIVFVTMLCHAGQARMADYYRGLHLYFLKGNDKADVTRAKDLKAELAALPKDSPLYERIYRHVYLIYTRDQERRTPRMQRLLNAIEEKDGAVPGVSETYVTESRRYIQLTNTLTYNIRTYTLFVLLILGLHSFYFPFVITVLEAVEWFMVAKYESIAKNIYSRFFTAGDGEGRTE